jgi:hypothetical protein
MVTKKAKPATKQVTGNWFRDLLIAIHKAGYKFAQTDLRLVQNGDVITVAGYVTASEPKLGSDAQPSLQRILSDFGLDGAPEGDGMVISVDVELNQDVLPVQYVTGLKNARKAAADIEEDSKTLQAQELVLRDQKGAEGVENWKKANAYRAIVQRIQANVVKQENAVTDVRDFKPFWLNVTPSDETPEIPLEVLDLFLS